MIRIRGYALSIVTALCVSGSLALSACTGNGSPASQVAADTVVKDGTITFGISSEPISLHAGQDTGTVGYTMNSLIHRGLMVYDTHGKLAPGLATSYRVVNPNTYEFKLRPNLKFSDGTKLDSSTVKQTLQYFGKPDSASYVFEAMKGIKTIETPDADTVIIHLSEPMSSFLQYLALPNAGIVPPGALNPGVDAWVGAGPFVVTDNKKGVGMTLTRNKSYYDAGKVPLKTLKLLFYPDGKARTNAILSGQVDLIDYVPWENFSQVKQAKGITLTTQYGPFMYLHFNVTKGPTANPLVRQAIAYAINRDNVVTAAFFGNAKPLNGMPVAKTDPNYDPAWSSMASYNPKKSKELLAQAGYDKGVTLRLLTTSQYTFHQDVAVSVQADLLAVGIKTKMENPDWATREKMGINGEYDIAVQGNVGKVDDLSYLAGFVAGPPSPNRSFGYDSPTLNTALSDALSATDPSKQKAFYDEARAIMVKEVPLVPIASRAQGFALTGVVGGFQNLPGFLSFYSGYTLASTAELAK